MCGRYFINTLPETLAEQFMVKTPIDLASSYNVAPTHLCPVVVGDPEDGKKLIDAHWGLVPFWAKDRKIGSRMINARIETAASKPAFRAAYKRRRCVVPATGFFEWVRTSSHKVPHAIVPGDQPMFGFAGLWESWRDPEDETLLSFTIVTTEAHGPISELHHRMPVMLDAPLMEHWLAGEPVDLAAVTAAAPTLKARFFPISTAVNSVRNNYPELLEPAAV
ncbi:MAG: SOS response-associated peptidase [Pseudomonadota bacterium]